MRYALFTDKQEADDFAKEVETLFNATSPEGVSVLVKYAAWIEWLGKYAVQMEVEPPVLRGEIVDSVEPVVEPIV